MKNLITHASSSQLVMSSRRKERSLSLLIVLVLAISSCYYDNAEDLYPTLTNVTCNTGAQISFSTEVLPLMNLECNTASCHNSIDRAAQIVLDTYTDLLISASDGSLIGSMRHSAGFIPMPDAAPKLDACSIELVAEWINQGALNN